MSIEYQKIIFEFQSENVSLSHVRVIMSIDELA